MKVSGFFVCLIMLVISQVLLAQVPKEYTKFERNEVKQYRDAYTFVMPELKLDTATVYINKDDAVAQYFPGDLSIFVDKSGMLGYMMAKHAEMNGNRTFAKGFRVQIFAGLERVKANDSKSKFMSMFPGVNSYLMHIEPSYRVRVGDFMEKGEADLFCRRLRDTQGFEGAFVVPETVLIPKYNSVSPGNDR